jgi:uncharacterized membrane protein YhiD involved in acid resistance
VDELMKEMARGTSMGNGFELWQAAAALSMSFVLCLIIAFFYRLTHRGLSYSVAFVHAMVIMGVTVSIIMLIIGSNIARAFSLVGALSIIRFRNAVKDSRDVAFIFLTMAVGMAVGTGFFATALVFTIFMCGVIYFLHRFNIGAEQSREVLVKVHLPASVDYHVVFNDVFFRYLKDSSLLGVETLQDGKLVELVYSVEFKTGAKENEFLQELRTLAGGNRVVLLAGQENINV